MKFLVDGEEIEAPETIRMGEAHEATRHLGIDHEKDGAVGALMTLVFVGMRRAHPDWPLPHVVAQVNAIELDTLDFTDEVALPLENNGSGAPAMDESPASETTPATSGRPSSETSSG